MRYLRRGIHSICRQSFLRNDHFFRITGGSSHYEKDYKQAFTDSLCMFRFGCEYAQFDRRLLPVQRSFGGWLWKECRTLDLLKQRSGNCRLVGRFGGDCQDHWRACGLASFPLHRQFKNKMGSQTAGASAGLCSHGYSIFAVSDPSAKRCHTAQHHLVCSMPICVLWRLHSDHADLLCHLCGDHPKCQRYWSFV